MADLLDDIGTRMFVLDRALPDNAAARDLLEILHKCRVEIERLRAHPVFAHADGYHVDEHSRLIIDFTENGGAILAFNELPLDTSPGKHGDGDG